MVGRKNKYDSACYYAGKKIGGCTVADGDAYVVLMNVMIVRKDSPVLTPILMTQSSTVDIRDMPGATWRDVVAAVLEQCKEIRYNKLRKKENT